VITGVALLLATITANAAITLNSATITADIAAVIIDLFEHKLHRMSAADRWKSIAEGDGTGQEEEGWRKIAARARMSRRESATARKEVR
jgi:hypothetical protein